MPENILIYLGGYAAIISLVAIFLTLYDKHAARKGTWRVKERTLLLVSALGGSVAMLATMRKVHHKTKHAKFMVGIPVIIVLQIAVVAFVYWQMKGGPLYS